MGSLVDSLYMAGEEHNVFSEIAVHPVCVLINWGLERTYEL